MNRDLSRYVHVVVLAICVAFCLVAVYGCKSLETVSEHAVQTGIGAGAGTLVGLVAIPGAGFLGILLVAIAGAIGAILSTPPCPPQNITNINGPGAHVTVRGALGQEAYGMPFWFWIAVGAWAVLTLRGRHWIPFLLSAESRGFRLAIIKHIYLGGKPPTIPPQFLTL